MRVLRGDVVRDDLGDLPLFSGASRSEMAVIGQQLTKLHLPAGRVLVQEGAIGSEFMVIVDGQAVVSQGGHLIATLGRGDLVGEMALLDARGRGRRNATVVARSDVVVYVGSSVEFRRILEAAPSVAAKVRQTVTARTKPQAA